MAYIRRKRLMLLFRRHEIRYHAEHLGVALATDGDDFNRRYHGKKIQESMKAICEKKSVKYDDLKLIESDLNDYINRIVSRAQDMESQRQKAREFVDKRIKIKRTDDSSVENSESVPD